MTLTMFSAVVLLTTITAAQGNQCPAGSECASNDLSPNVVVSMLQTKLQMNVPVSAAEAATLGVSHAVEDVDRKKGSLVGNMLMLNEPAAILTEFEQKVTAGEAPAFDVISQIKTLILDDIMPYLQESRDQAIQQATELSALVTACNDDFKSSDVYPGSTMEKAVNSARSDHITCRDVQENAHGFNLTQPDSYCVKLGKLLHDTSPLSSPGASASPRATSVASVASALHTIPSCNSDVLQLDANCTQQETALANKHQECSVKQATFEFRYCEWKDGLESKCKTLDSCYSTTSGLYNAHVAQMNISLEKWDIENSTLHAILCYCNVWLSATDSSDNRSQHNATHFEVCKGRTHSSGVVKLELPQKGDCLLGSVSNHPGTQGFSEQEYGSFTEFVEPVIPCVPDCGANEKIVASVCVECPAGTTSPGGNSIICDVTLCGTDEKVVGHTCVECGAGETSDGNHDASGGDTQCQATTAAPTTAVPTTTQAGTTTVMCMSPKMDWKSSRAWCQSKGGDLISIHSAEENQAVVDFATASFGSDQSYGPWIGLAQPEGPGPYGTGSGTYSWSDGMAVDYQATWSLNNPASERKAISVILYPSHSGWWADINVESVPGWLVGGLCSVPSGRCEAAYADTFSNLGTASGIEESGCLTADGKSLNSYHADGISNDDSCKASCLQGTNCVGYSFHPSNRRCFIYGENVQTTPPNTWGFRTGTAGATGDITQTNGGNDGRTCMARDKAFMKMEIAIWDKEMAAEDMESADKEEDMAEAPVTAAQSEMHVTSPPCDEACLARWPTRCYWAEEMTCEYFLDCFKKVDGSLTGYKPDFNSTKCTPEVKQALESPTTTTMPSTSANGPVWDKLVRSWCNVPSAGRAAEGNTLPSHKLGPDFSSLSAAKAACAQDPQCNGVMDWGCDGTQINMCDKDYAYQAQLQSVPLDDAHCVHLKLDGKWSSVGGLMREEGTQVTEKSGISHPDACGDACDSTAGCNSFSWCSCGPTCRLRDKVLTLAMVGDESLSHQYCGCLSFGDLNKAR